MDTKPLAITNTGSEKGKPNLSAKQAGYSLALVMVLGAVTSLWVEALMAVMVPTYEKMVMIQGRDVVRSASEAGMDYVVAQLNGAVAAGTTSAPWSSYDTNSYGQTKYTMMSSSIIGSSSMKAVPQVVVGVTNYAPSTNCTLYDSSISANFPANTSQNPWRIIDSYSVLGPFHKHIRLILEPVIAQATKSSTNQLPSLPFAVFGETQVDSMGWVITSSYNNPAGSPWNADVGSNEAVNELGTGSLARPVQEGGNHVELPVNLNTANAIIQNFANSHNATIVSSAPWTQILNNVYSNNDTTGYYPGVDPQAPSLPSSPSAQNVLGLNSYTGASNPGGQVAEFQSYSQANIPTAPNAPSGSFVQSTGGVPSASGSQNIGSINIANGAKIVISDSATTVPTSGTVNSGTLTIPPGNYVVNSITLTGNASIVVNSTSPTQFFIQGNTPGTTAISISNSASINMEGNASPGTSTNMQIFYNGSKDVDLDGQITGIVYAPNAVNFYVGQGLSNTTYYYGAVVGDSVYLNGGLSSGGGVRFFYDSNLKPSNSGETSGGSVFGYGSTNSITYNVSGFKGVSWMEVHDNPTNALGVWTSWPTSVRSLLGL